MERGDQSSGIIGSRCDETLITCEEERFRKNSPGESGGLHQPTTESHMVVEEEQEILSGRNLMENYDGWNSEDGLNDKNLKSN
nr:hypothetical protein CFP56_24765 [Quercus suber]